MMEAARQDAIIVAQATEGKHLTQEGIDDRETDRATRNQSSRAQREGY
jgi:hypothetical protein